MTAASSGMSIWPRVTRIAVDWCMPTRSRTTFNHFSVIPEDARPMPKFEDEGSVFAGKNVGYCIEKLYEFIHYPNSAIATHIAEFGWEQIISALQELETKARRRGANPEHSNFPTALHAAMELQQYISKQECSITSEIEASVYLQSLEHDLDELRRMERDLDEEAEGRAT
jgi:hypothetical protein